MKVLLLGSDGYIGTALVQRLLREGHEVVGVDNGHRRKNVKEMRSFSAVPIKSMQEKAKLLGELGNFHFFKMDITDHKKLQDVFSLVKPDVVVNLAHQPSAPFSQIDYAHAAYTTQNNIMGTLNVLWCMKEIVPHAHLCELGTMGEYNPNINTDIAEGTFQFEYNGRVSNTCLFPRAGGSQYHVTKCCSTYYVEFASRAWGITITDIMQGILYGNWTPEIEKYGIHTRYDTDESFGTVLNRFIVQTVLGVPLTIFGEGLHKRGFLALADSIQCLMLAIDNPPRQGEYRTWNQLDESFSMNEVADKVLDVARKFGIMGTKSYITSPRVECLEDHYYNPITQKVRDLGFSPTRKMEDEIEYMFKKLLPIKDQLEPLKKVVLPNIKW